MKNPSNIKNKVKRTAVYQKYKAQKKKTKAAAKDERLKAVEALGAAAPPKQVTAHLYLYYCLKLILLNE